MEKDKEFKQVSLGLEEKKGLSAYLSSVKRRVVSIGKEIKYSGLYNNFWLWNIIFLNILTGLVLWYLIFKNYTELPETIGLNLYDIEEYDTMIHRSSLYVLVLFHFFIALVTLAFGIKAQKKLHHLFIVSFVNYLVLSFFEFYALRNLIEYFV